MFVSVATRNRIPHYAFLKSLDSSYGFRKGAGAAAHLAWIGFTRREEVTLIRPALAVLATAAALALVGAQPALARDHGPGSGGVVFVQTNEPSGNKIDVFDRGSDGRLSLADTYPAGGLGGVAAPGTESDHLASQGSLALTADGKTLIAVNAGSDTVTSFRVQGDRLQLRSIVSSGGQFPASVAVKGQLVYVLNSGGTGIVQGFRIQSSRLVPLSGSARSLGLANGDPPDFLTSPGQVGFTPDGSQLLVTTKASTSSIDVFQVGSDGRLSASPVVNPSATPVPFAFTFGSGRLVDGEAATSSVTTYVIGGDGTLSDPLSASDSQMALCWILRISDVYYVTNTASNNVSSFTVDSSGQPSLLEAIAAPTNPGPIDMATSGGYLYVETGMHGTVDEFAVNSDGTLTRIGTVTGLPPGLEGIAAT
jgi:Lactonase, 7-bladed beta-propeller